MGCAPPGASLLIVSLHWPGVVTGRTRSPHMGLERTLVGCCNCKVHLQGSRSLRLGWVQGFQRLYQALSLPSPCGQPSLTFCHEAEGGGVGVTPSCKRERAPVDTGEARGRVPWPDANRGWRRAWEPSLGQAWSRVPGAGLSPPSTCGDSCPSPEEEKGR